MSDHVDKNIQIQYLSDDPPLAGSLAPYISSTASHSEEDWDVAVAEGMVEDYLTDLDKTTDDKSEASLLTEAALAADWNLAEEDEAWSHLQP